MASRYYSYIAHFPAIDTTEATELIDGIDAEPALNDLRKLAAASAEDLGRELESYTSEPFSSYWESVTAHAAALVGTFTPADPDDPTPAEQVLMDRLMPDFFAAWPVSKRPALQHSLDLLRTTETNSWDWLTTVSTTTRSTARPLHEMPFFVLLAEYYLAMANDYITKASQRYYFLGRVLNGTDGPPKSGVRVLCTDEFLAPHMRVLGRTTTDRNGYFRMPFDVINGVATTYNLKFTFSHAELGSPVTEVLTYDNSDPRTATVVELTFTAPASTSKTIAETGVTIPTDVQTWLTTNSITITRLEDIRQLGGFRNIPDDSIDKEDPDLLKLDALASLEILDGDLTNNETLHTRGYSGLSQIARASRRQFVEENTDILGDFGAGRLHYQARAAHLFALNKLAGSYAPVPGELEPAEPVAVATGCGCSDCSSAVSPLAYLADLLSFVTSRVEHEVDDDPVEYGGLTLAVLEDLYFQKFAALRADCDQLKDTYCQNRLAAEVMRAYYDALPGTPNAAQLESDREEYLWKTYDLLLNKLGTSYMEVRKLRAVVDPDERRKVSDRLGIVLEHTLAPEDTLDSLFVDGSDLGNLTEAWLEEMFGLRDSGRDVLTATPVGKVSIWKKAWLRELWAKQQAITDPYHLRTEVIIDPDVVTLDDLRTPGTGNASAIWENRREWLDELFLRTPVTFDAPAIDHRASDNVIVVYGETDINAVAINDTVNYEENGGSPPGVDYTCTGRAIVNGNLEITVQPDIELDKANGTITIDGGSPVENDETRSFDAPDLSTWLGQMITAQTYNRIAAVGGSFTVEPWPTESSGDDAIGELRARVAPVRSGDAAAIASLLTDFQLLPAELFHLVDFIDGYKGYPFLNIHAENNYSEAQWEDVRSILIAAFKRKARGAAGAPGTGWIGEEQAASVVLGPVDFHPAMKEPLVGEWPPFTSEVRLLDPDLVSEADVAESTRRLSSPAALTFLTNRRTALATARGTISTAYGTGVEEAFNAAFGHATIDTWAEYTTLLNDLNSPVSSEAAITTITGELKVSVEDYKWLMETGEGRRNGIVPNAVAEDRLLTILTGAHKRCTLYGTWETEENAEPYWELRKARLPKWRATPEQRKAWLAALAEHSARPMIDADLIGPGDLRNPLVGDAAYDLWAARYAEMHTSGWIAAITAETFFTTPNTTNFNALTAEYLDHAEDGLHVIRAQEDAGVDIRPRVAQLNLTMTEYAQLMACRDLVDAPTTLTGEEVTSIKHILAQVQKRRKFYAYRTEELAEDPALTLSQDYFKLPKADYSAFPSTPEHPLLPWLVQETDLIAWRRSLRGRVEQEATVEREYRTLLEEVDDAMVLHLRDAYVRASANEGESQIRAARRLGDLLLMDLENNCCYKTNRVAAAIETVQQLIWKTGTGDILGTHPDFRYEGDDFDEAWTWIGSYANWRAAMFVFLYPENVLIPSLRKYQTPAFQAVVEATRNNRRFGPQAACEVAHTYREYLKDVSNLKLSCSVQARLFDGQRECGKPQNEMKTVNFVFASAANSKKAYWTTVDSRDAANIHQDRFWAEVPGVESGALLKGASYYKNQEEEVDHVYLFFLSPKSEHASKFFAARFSVERNTWEDEVLEFEIEQDDLANHMDHATSGFDEEDFETKIGAFAVMRNLAEWEAPELAVSLWCHSKARYYTFTQRLNDKGTELVSTETWDKWHTFFVKDEPKIAAYLQRTFDGQVVDVWRVPAADGNWQNALVFMLLDLGHDGWNTKVVRRRLYTSDTEDKATNISAGLGPNTLVRHLFYDSVATTLHFLTGQKLQLGRSPDQAVKVTGVLNPAQNNAADLTIAYAYQTDFPGNVLKHVATITAAIWTPDGVPYAGNVIPLIYQTGTDPTIKVCTVNTSGSPSLLQWGDDVLRITPDIQNMPVIGAYTNEADQEARKTASTAAWQANDEGNFRLIEHVQEGFYFVPMQIALQLHANGHYQAALDWFRTVYDFRKVATNRKIHYGLVREEAGDVNTQRAADWYGDPLNPHGTASMRRHTYTRYTVLSIAYCLLDFADAEFTTDNSETVPRARELYEDALGLLELVAPPRECASDTAITNALGQAELGPWTSSFSDVLADLEKVQNEPGFDDLLENINTEIGGADPMPERLEAVRDLIAAAVAAVPTRTMDEVLEDHDQLVNDATAGALAGAEADAAILGLSGSSAGAFDRAMEAVTGRVVSDIDEEAFPWFTDRSASSDLLRNEEVDPMREGKSGQMVNYYVEAPAKAFHLNNPLTDIWLSGVPFQFCAVPNPMVAALLMRAEVNLFKIRNCMNIAGMMRELDPFAAPTDSTTGLPVIGVGGTLSVPTGRSIPPSPYRYRAIVDRAKQLVAMAQQVEAAFLSALEKFDAESYSRLRAEQDIETTKAGIKLQDLKIKEADSGVKLAELQKERATLQVSGLQGMIDEGLTAYEKHLLDLYLTLGAVQAMLAGATAMRDVADSTVRAAGAALPMSGVAWAGTVVSNVARFLMLGFELGSIGLQTSIQVTSLLASVERRRQEWEFQQSIARQDEKIGEQGIKLAQDRLRIVGQEREIAVLQNEHAKATLDFLKNKFTSSELYEWMSKVLEDIYSWFLQEATSMALMAQRQLSFERQVDLPPFIRTDYWVVDGGSTGGISITGEGAVDRRGITGSTRLLKDLYELDQYAFNTNSPKLQMSKTISLQEIAPEELMRLRNEGVMSFFTTEAMFDRDYPGHYLRLIKRVSVTVIALTPPTKGVRATLTNGGVSTVVVGGTIFQKRTINRYPEQIALSSGVNDHGVFQLQAEGEFLNPFEGHGVETQWEFRMEKAANPFDFGSIADVLVTIEYEAMNSFSYRQKVVQQLNGELTSGALAISFKNNLPDQWFDLHHPEQLADPYKISFTIAERDLAPNVTGTRKVSAVTLFVVMKGDAAFSGTLDIGPNGHVQRLQPNDNVVSQLMLKSLVGANVTGTWTFGVPVDNSAGRTAFAEDAVEDVVLIVGYEGENASYG